jgi:hypothetical protein
MRKTPPTAIRGEELAMNTALGRKIVAGWASTAFSMPAFRVHQVEYPEVEAEGRTPAEASVRLIALLVAAGDFANVAWKRESLVLALGDARRFSRCFNACAWVEPRPSGLPSM